MDTSTIVKEIEAKSYSIHNNFITEVETLLFLDKIKELQQHHSFRRAGTGNTDSLQKNSEIRSDTIFWLDDSDATINKMFFDKINELVMDLNRNLYLGINDHEFHLAHYPAGGFYKKHKDAFKSDDARKISVILYLNRNWKKENGGELKLYLENSTETIEPLAGRLVVFESHLEHEVLESKTDRYSITGWLKSKKFAF